MKIISKIVLLAAVFTASCGEDSSVLNNENTLFKVKFNFENMRAEEKGGNICLTIVPEGAKFPEAKEEDIVYAECVKAETANAQGMEVELPKGTYAAAIFQDENENGKLDMKKIIFIPAPKEDFGFSGNPPLMKGAPSFDDCKFEVSEDIELLIKMRKI